METTDTKKREINLPFPGFYESIYSTTLDHYEEMEAEWFVERMIREAKEGREEIEIDEELFPDKGEIAELIFKHCDYGKVHLQVAQFYVEAFDHFACSDLGLPTGSFTWAAMVSPREYNFTTDRIFANISDEALDAMWKQSVADEHKTLAQVLEDRHTSYSGFHSWYSNRLEDWLAKPVAEWDHNELASLLHAVIRLHGYTDSEMGETLYEYVFGGGDAEAEAIDAGMNWDEFHRDVEKLKQEAIAA